MSERERERVCECVSEYYCMQATLNQYLPTYLPKVGTCRYKPVITEPKVQVRIHIFFPAFFPIYLRYMVCIYPSSCLFPLFLLAYLQ